MSVRKLIAFGLTLAIDLALVWAGLHYDRALLIGAVLIGLALAGLWLWDWGRAKRPSAEDDKRRKRKLIDEGRRLGSVYGLGKSGDKSFRQFLERTTAYAALRPHLSRDYLEKLNAPRATYAMKEGARYEPLVEWFLDDLDRLEKKWGLS